MMRAVC